MLEIKKRNNYWECYLDGGFYYYNESLANVLNYLARCAEEIEQELDK